MESLGRRDYKLGRKLLPESTSLRKRERKSRIVHSKMTSTSEDMLECGGGDASTLPLLSRRSPTPEEEEEEETFDVQKGDDRGSSDSGIENEAGEPPHVPASPSTRDKDAQGPEQKERLRTVALQIFLPFMMAGLGCVFAGMLLDHVEVGTKCGCGCVGEGVCGCVGEGVCVCT